MFNFSAMGSEIVRAKCPECGLINVRIASKIGRVQCIQCGHVFWKPPAQSVAKARVVGRQQARRVF